MAPHRIDSFPDVPTLGETLDTDYQIGEWRGIAGPEGMDPEVVAILEEALDAAYHSDTYQNFMAKQGFGTEWRNANDFGDFMADMDAKFGQIVDQVGLAK